jgi:hypothetical protein
VAPFFGVASGVRLQQWPLFHGFVWQRLHVEKSLNTARTRPM